MLPPEDGVSYSAPAAADRDGVLYGSVTRAAGEWSLVKITPAGGTLEEPTVVLPPDRRRFSLLRDGKSLAVETAAGTLLRVQLPGGETTPLWAGTAPVGFVNRARPGSLAPAPPSTAFHTPTPQPSPTPTPSATPAPYQPMSLLISVRQGTTYITAATVTAWAGDLECARGQTDATGRVSLQYPAQSAPQECRIPGAEIQLRVNGEPVAGFNTYSPGGVTTRDIQLP
jgi:hypothetical protein